MKKLLFATALAASAAAFANPINAVGFENYDSGKTFLNGGEESNEYGEATKYFYFDGESNSSVVTNVGASSTRTAYFDSLDPKPANTNYLALDTEGGTFWRSINQISNSGETYGLGTEQPVASTGTYLDTLVQFTVTEDDAPEVGSDDKLAIWLQATTNSLNETVTNLMVKAGYYDDQGNFDVATFSLTGKDIEAGTWYRLTVEAIDDIVDQNSEFAGSLKLPAFVIKVDGTTMAATTATMDATFAQGLQQSTVITADVAAKLTAGTTFVSMVQGTPGTATTLQGVGFKGTGAVDEIVWTEEDPFPAATGGDFTLTWDANVTAVSFTIDGTTTDLSSETSPYTITGLAADTAVTVNASAAEWYVISSGTGVVTAVAGGTNEIVAALAATPGDAGATGLPAGATTAQVKTWADAKGLTPAQIAASTFAEKAYLLNTDLTVEPTFAIAAIEEVEGGWQITVEAKAGNTEIDLENINGTLKVKTAATLTALGEATSDDIPAANLNFDSEGKAVIKITGSGKNFIKATVE